MKMKAYLPDFNQAFEHFCIHTGGRGVIDGMEKQLNLSRESMQPTRDALYRFGNVSSSSIWCALSSCPESCCALQSVCHEMNSRDQYISTALTGWACGLFSLSA